MATVDLAKLPAAVTYPHRPTPNELTALNRSLPPIEVTYRFMHFGEKIMKGDMMYIPATGWVDAYEIYYGKYPGSYAFKRRLTSDQLLSRQQTLDALYKDGLKNNYDNLEFFTCDSSACMVGCEWAFDPYNTNCDCLAVK